MAMDFKSASFIKAVEKWADATESEFVATCGGSMLMLQRMVVDGTGSLSGTPKDTGQAKSNWFIGVNEDITTQSTDTTKQNMQNAQTVIAQAIANPDNVSLFHYRITYLISDTLSMAFTRKTARLARLLMDLVHKHRTACLGFQCLSLSAYSISN